MAPYESRVIEPSIAYFKFSEGTTAELFKELFDPLNAMLGKEEITRLVVVMAMAEPGDEELRQLWFNVGKTAHDNKIEKLGIVVAPQDIMKKIALEHVIKGDGDRTYEARFSESEDEILIWCKG